MSATDSNPSHSSLMEAAFPFHLLPPARRVRLPLQETGPKQTVHRPAERALVQLQGACQLGDAGFLTLLHLENEVALRHGHAAAFRLVRQGTTTDDMSSA